MSTQSKGLGWGNQASLENRIQLLVPNSLDPSRARDSAGVWPRSKRETRAYPRCHKLPRFAAPVPPPRGMCAIGALKSQQTGDEHHFPLSDPSRPGTPPRSADAAGAVRRVSAHLLLCLLGPRRPPLLSRDPWRPWPAAQSTGHPTTARLLRPRRRRQLTPRSLGSRRPPGPAPTCHGGGHGAAPSSSAVHRPARGLR